MFIITDVSRHFSREEKVVAPPMEPTLPWWDTHEIVIGIVLRGSTFRSLVLPSRAGTVPLQTLAKGSGRLDVTEILRGTCHTAEVNSPVTMLYTGGYVTS